MPTPEPERAVRVARLGAPFGVRGELKCRPLGDADSVASGATYRLERSAGARALACTGVRMHAGTLLVRFAGVDTPEAARELTGRELFADVADVALAPNEYLDRELIGCALVDPQGTPLGVVRAIGHLPAQDCLVVGDGERLVPLVAAFVRGIDLDARTIAVELPDGLLD